MTPVQKERNLKLAEALESGKYQQHRGSLRSQDSFCCLGIACELYRIVAKKGKWLSKSIFEIWKLLYESIVPLEVARWYRWNSSFGIDNPFLPTGSRSYRFAAELNDNSMWSFKKIAKAFRRLVKNS